MIRFAIACALLAHMGCYDPSVRDCAVTCQSAKECAGGQVCSNDGYCVGASYRGRCARQAPIDATPMMTDAADAPAAPDGSGSSTLCQQRCTNGTCDAQGVCMIDCSASGACASSDVMCPMGIPCKVVCGDHACTHKIQCQMATSCDVQCIGPSSCGDVITCGMGACDVKCLGDGSCHRHTECGMACSCDVTCSGDNSCGEVSKCPAGTACVLGHGCTSQLPTCDSCS